MLLVAVIVVVPHDLAGFEASHVVRVDFEGSASLAGVAAIDTEDLATSFEEVGDALMQMLAASQQHDWEVRHRAAEHLGISREGLHKKMARYRIR